MMGAPCCPSSAQSLCAGFSQEGRLPLTDTGAGKEGRALLPHRRPQGSCRLVHSSGEQSSWCVLWPQDEGDIPAVGFHSLVLATDVRFLPMSQARAGGAVADSGTVASQVVQAQHWARFTLGFF